jgi:two-component system LytT family response regulator
MKAIQQHNPDLIFLDVQMPKINGFELLELIDNPPAIIFTTAFDEYAIKAFESNAIDYLLKPFTKERFNKAVQKFSSNGIAKINTETNLQVQSGSQNRIVVKTDGKIKIIPTSELQYIEANGDNVKIVAADGSYSKNKTMSYFEQQLPANDFIRIHRSYIVNVSMVTRIDAYDKESHLAVLSTGIQLPVSKTGYQKLKEILGM